MAESDRPPPTARADFVVSRHRTVPTLPSVDEGALLPTIEPTPVSYRTVVPEADRTTERRLVSAAPALGADQRAMLTVLTGMHAGQVHTLGEECVIGRGGDVHLPVDDHAVSRRHARIVNQAGAFMFEDLGSTNGSFVDGRRVMGRQLLTSGARVQLGPNLMLRYAIVDRAEESLQRRLYESSTRDPLTGTFNRSYLANRLVAETAHARRHKADLSLLMIDLDAFKAVNDEHGHLAGDAVLREVAELLKQTVRVEDVLARYGGEEFCVVLRATGITGALRLGERVRQVVRQHQVAFGAVRIGVTVSVGVATLAEVTGLDSESQLLALADARLYRAKVAGRDRVCASDV